MASSDKRATAGLATTIVVRGQYGVVLLSDRAKAEYDALRARTDETGIREAATIERYFQRFADMGPDGLDNPKMQKSLGRFKDGTGGMVQVFEMKAYQWRVYGVRRNYNGMRAFIGLCVDPDKKKDKANPDLMKRCARMSSEL